MPSNNVLVDVGLVILGVLHLDKNGHNSVTRDFSLHVTNGQDNVSAFLVEHNTVAPRVLIF